LSGITQVAAPSELYPVHNRLTHTLKVAQVARGLAESLLQQPDSRYLLSEVGGLDLDVVEAASLAHDLGHPPFGHVAERTLDQLLISDAMGASVPDGYDGNAQSFRIVTKLAVHRDSVPGLNLTRATLNAILKYPWQQSTDPEVRLGKWGVFDTEHDDFVWCRCGTPAGEGLQSLEATIMDWADDITYAVHDMEDFFRAGLIPLDRFAQGAGERELEYFFRNTYSRRKSDEAERNRLKAAFQRTEVFTIGLPGPFRGSRTDRAALRKLTSSLIHRYITESMQLVETPHGVVLRISPELQDEVRILKELTWAYVIDSTSLVAQRFGQRTLIRSLFATFYDAAISEKDRAILPQLYRDDVERAEGDPRQIKRVVADLISSMSEAQVVAIHQRLTGQSLGSAMDAYLQ